MYAWYKECFFPVDIIGKHEKKKYWRQFSKAFSSFSGNPVNLSKTVTNFISSKTNRLSIYCNQMCSCDRRRPPTTLEKIARGHNEDEVGLGVFFLLIKILKDFATTMHVFFHLILTIIKYN